MIPLYSKCYVDQQGVGFVEAVCNDKPMGGTCWSYCVRLSKSPQKLTWFSCHEVSVYDGPNEEEDNDQAEDQDKTEKETRRKSKRTFRS
jgi:hypothetical protein